MVAGGVIVGLVAVGGVAALAGQRLLSSGAADQPAAVLPVDSLVYARVDFDPSAAQKVAAFRLFDKLPEAKNALGDSNPKKALFELMAKNNEQLKDVDYAADIEPWLGDRMGMAVLAPKEKGGDPIPVAAIQVTDEAKANEGMTKLREKSQGLKLNDLADQAKKQTGLNQLPTVGNRATATLTPQPNAGGNTTSDDTVHWYRDGYLLLTDKASEQTVRDAVDKGQLTANADFTADMNDLGEQGVMSGWMNTPKLMDAALANDTSGSADTVREFMDMVGRQAMALRFNPGSLEMTSIARGATGNVDRPAARDLAKLPGDTAAFFSVTGGGEQLKTVWPKLEKAISQSSPSFSRDLDGFKKATNVAIPEDLQTLLGTQFDLIISEKSVKDRLPVLGLRLLTDTTKAESVLGNMNNLLKQVSPETASVFGLNTKTERDFVYVGATTSYRDELVAGGNLGDDATVKEAVKDLASASSVLYVNLDKIESLYLPAATDPQAKDLLESLKAVGVSSVTNGDRTESTMRLLVN